MVFILMLFVQTGHSIIVETDGYAYLSEDKTIKEIRETALLDAKRKAIEQFGTYIQSYSEVKNFQLKKDIIQSGSEAEVKVIEQKDYGIEKDNRYHIWIKAEVKYAIKKGKPFYDIPNAPLTVGLYLQKKEYKDGDTLRFFVKANKDCYIKVFYRTADSSIIQIFPNEYKKENFIHGGIKYRIPGKGDKFNLIIQPPFGKENIILYASTLPIPDVPVSELEDSPFALFKGDIESLQTGVRGIKITGNKTPEFYSEALEVETKK